MTSILYSNDISVALLKGKSQDQTSPGGGIDSLGYYIYRKYKAYTTYSIQNKKDTNKLTYSLFYFFFFLKKIKIENFFR